MFFDDEMGAAPAEGGEEMPAEGGSEEGGSEAPAEGGEEASM